MLRSHFKAHAAAKLPALLAALLLTSAAAGLAQIPADQISPKALRKINKILKVKASLSPAEQKIASNIGLASRQVRFQPIGGTDNLIDRSNIDDAGLATVKITGKVNKHVLALIAANGGQVIASYKDQHTILAKLPLTALPVVAADPKIVHIEEPDLCVNNVGAVTSQGYVTHRAKNVVEGLGINGTGVKVGVLSVSATAARVAALQASGDLPANTTVLAGQAGTGDDEGTAMMEIIYDLAPGAQLYFATGNTGVAQFAANIQALSAQGCQVIVDDITYFNEGVFQDGPIAQAVNTFVAGGGIYFSSAANSGNVDAGTGGTWEGDFLSGGAATGVTADGGTSFIHNFGTAASPVLYDTLTVATTYVSLKWSDPLTTSTNDYDLFVLNSTGTTVLASSTTRQVGAGDPYEIAVSPNDASGNATTFPVGARIVVVQYNATATQTTATRALHLDSNRGALSIATSGNTFGHNAGANTQSVAATFWNSAKTGTVAFNGTSNPVELFSSDGLRKIFYTPTGTQIGSGAPLFANTTAGQTLLKPDFTAADGVTCKTPGFSPFFGTSAAAPHAAAIAALMISAKSTITNTQIHNILIGSGAQDNGASGYDRDGGYGVLDAFNAVSAALALP